MIDDPKKVVPLSIFICGLIFDILLAEENRDIRLFSLLLFWILLVIFTKLKSDATIKLALGLLGALFLLFISDPTSAYTERIGTWIYFLLVIAVGQQILEFWRKRKETK